MNSIDIDQLLAATEEMAADYIQLDVVDIDQLLDETVNW